MAIICPALLAENPHVYRTQLERVSSFAKRVHIDFCDGAFAPVHTISIDQAWWPKGVKADMHLMYKRPGGVIDKLIALKPNLVIVHAEAEGDFFAMSKRLRSAGVKVGLALLQNTASSYIERAMNEADHILIFSGDLGSFGGRADLKLLEKVEQLKARRPDIEIGWDGGINDQNALRLVEAGVEVLDVGGYIQRAEEPQIAYDKLLKVIGSYK